MDMICGKCGHSLTASWGGYSHRADYRGARHVVKPEPAPTVEEVEDDGLTDLGRALQARANEWEARHSAEWHGPGW